MDEHIMERYLAEVPYEFREAVMSLSNDKNWAIYIALVKEGEKRFNEIKDQFGSNHSPEIDRALKTLINGGLIEKVAHEPIEIGNINRSYYSVSEMGIKFIDCLGDILSPEPQKPAVPFPIRREVPVGLKSGVFFPIKRGFEPIRARGIQPKYEKPMSAAGGSK